VYKKDAVPFGGGPAHPHYMCHLTSVFSDEIKDETIRPKETAEEKTPTQPKEQKTSAPKKTEPKKKEYNWATASEEEDLAFLREYFLKESEHFLERIFEGKSGLPDQGICRRGFYPAKKDDHCLPRQPLQNKV